MPKMYGNNYSATDPLKSAPGSSVDAGKRLHRETFNTTTHGLSGTVNTAVSAKVRAGGTVVGFRMKANADLSALTFSVGTEVVPAKYAGGINGGAANAMKEFEIKIAPLLADPLAAMEEIIITPSGNWPAGADVVTFVDVIKR